MKKRVYTKPELITTFIDNEISLIMMTSEEEPPGPPKGAASQATSTDSGPTQQNNFNENPFGE